MVKRKSIFIILMSLLLVPTLMGCKEKEISAESSEIETVVEEEVKVDSEVDNSLFESSTKEIKDIKEILEKYGVKVDIYSEDSHNSKATISEFVEDAEIGSFSYSIATKMHVNTTDRVNGTYSVFYDSFSTKEGKSRYEYQIHMNFSGTEDFKIDNFSMFKELVIAHFGSDYDLYSLESFIQELLNKEKEEDRKSRAHRVNGIYWESVSGGNIIGASGIHRSSLVYTITIVEQY